MRRFTTVELLRDLKTVTIAASRAPVAITQHRKPRYVLMTVEDFDKLVRSSNDPRQAYFAHETPAELKEVLLSGLDEIIAGKGDDER